MSRPTLLICSRALPRVAAFSLIAIAAAGCSDSGRFEVNNPFSSGRTSSASQQEVTGSISHSAPTGRVEARPLPAPGRPQTMPAGGVAQGAHGLGAYRPPADVTGSVGTPRPSAPAGHWTWEGGTPVTVGATDTVQTISRRYGVPTSAIMQANGLTNERDLRPGQRLVIPRYSVGNQASMQSAPQPVVAPPASVPASVAPRQVAAATHAPTHSGATAGTTVHVAEPGDTLMRISRRYHVSLTTLARANNLKPFTKISIGDRIAIPGRHGAVAPQRQASAPVQAPQHHQVAEQAPKTSAPRSVPAQQPQRVASVPQTQAPVAAPVTTQTANMATAEQPKEEHATKTAEAAGNLPSFRWPVRGRVIAGFGPRINGQQNDGINLAVPEGTPIKAAEDGVVAYAGNELKGYGNLVLIRHANGYVSAYAHASELDVKRGEAVKRGQVIGKAGQTGNVTSPQLHFEIRKGSTPVDPTKYLSGA